MGTGLYAQTLEPMGSEKAALETAQDIRIGRGLPLAGLAEMDGSPAADTVSLQRWRQAVFEMRHGARRELGWPAGRVLSQQDLLQKKTTANWQRLSLALLHARYEEESATEKRQTHTVFAFSPLQTRVFHGAALELRLEADSYLRHAVEAATEFWLDADDGLGLRPLTLGETLPVSYRETGTKTLTLQARMPHGDSLQSSAQLEVAQLITPDPDDTWNIVASESWDGVAGSGSAWKCRHRSSSP